MKDIRINKSKIKLNRIQLSFYKINFNFFSKILNKYKNNDCVNFLTSQKIPLIFFIESDNNEPILKSISEIIDILNKREKRFPEKKDFYPEENNSQYVTSINQEFSPHSQSNFDNTYESPSLTYKYNSKNIKIVQALESVVNKIKKNINLGKKKNREEKLLEKQDNKIDSNLKKQEIESNKTNLSKKNIKNERNITKENILINKKISSKDIKENAEDLVVETFKKRKINSENIKKITSEFKKINENIIKRNINSIKINKINYDFISNNKKISKSIYDKVNKVLFSIINKNDKIKRFSEFSKNIIILNKKIGSKNIISKLNEFIRKRNFKYIANHSFNQYKNQREKEKIEKIYQYSKISDYKSLFDSIYSFNSFISKNNFLSEESYNNMINKSHKIKKTNKYISEKNIKDKINYYKLKNNILFNRYKTEREERKIEKIYHYSKTADYKSLFDSISSFNSFISKNNSSHIITKDLIDIKKNKVSKSSKSFRSFLEFFLVKFKNINLNSLDKEKYFHKIISKYLNSYSKLESSNFEFQRYNDFLFNTKSNFIFDSIKNFDKKIRENDFENYVYSNKNIVYRNKIDIKKIIDDSIEKIVDSKMQKKSKEIPRFFHHNEKVSNILQKFRKKEQPKSSPESITRKEVDQMIQSYVESINFQKISERAVMSVEDKIRMERYRNGLI